MYPNPEALWQAAWQLLTRANNDRKHPFRTATLSTVSAEGLPEARTLVMRKADGDRYTLRLYTDARSAKVTDWSANPIVHWLFWDRKKQIQFGASGKIERWDKAREADLFHQLPKHGRKAYATVSPPGTKLLGTPDGLPRDWDELSTEATDYALENFAVFESRLDAADILHLDREHGNRRVKGVRNGDTWTLGWVVP